MLMAILIVFVLIALVGSLPVWPHSKKWGLLPAGGVSLFLLIIALLLFAHR